MPRKKSPSKNNLSPSQVTTEENASSPHCQVFVHADGIVQIMGDEQIVKALMERLTQAGLTIRWDYHSRCG